MTKFVYLTGVAVALTGTLVWLRAISALAESIEDLAL